MNTRITEVTAALEEMKVRRALAVALLDIWNDVRWYLRRSRRPRQQTLRTVFEAWIRLLCPFIPFAAEELNKKVMGNKGLISTAEWPSTKDFRVDSTAVVSEQLLTKVIEDARNLLKIVKKDHQKSTLNIYAPSEEANHFFVEMVRSGTDKAKRGETIKRFSGLGIRPDRVIKLEYELGSDLSQKIAEAADLDEYEVLADASQFLSREICIQIKVAKAGQKNIHDPANKAKDALPFKPAFLLE
jgi:leucyl-tRNA synthetase